MEVGNTIWNTSNVVNFFKISTYFELFKKILRKLI
jgi:hypothetical protein